MATKAPISLPDVGYPTLFDKKILPSSRYLLGLGLFL